MQKGNQEREGVFEFSRETNRLQTQPLARKKNRMPPPPPVRRSPEGLASTWRSTALFSLFLLLVLAFGLAYQGFKRATLVEQQLEDTQAAMAASMHDLRAVVDFNSIRRQLVLGIRDEILRVNDVLSLAEAHHYAEILLDATDRYPSVDPSLLLSIGIVESEFNSKARSRVGARGLYQIWPTTGRMLAGMLGWQYTDAMLYDVERNTEMAVLYLDILLSTYNDLGMALAEYNGGPINAGYFRAGSRQTAAETADYVPKVLSQYERLVKKLPMAPGRSYDVLYRDASRAGKILGAPVYADMGALTE